MGRSNFRIPLWIDDFEAHILDTMEPTLATGARVRLWMAAARRKGILPADEDWMAKRAGLSNEDWQTVRSYLLPSWQRTRLRDGREVYIVRRVRSECRRLSDERERKREAGAASARSRKAKRDNESRGAVPEDVGARRNSSGTHPPSPSPSPSQEEDIGRMKHPPSCAEPSRASGSRAPRRPLATDPISDAPAWRQLPLPGKKGLWIVGEDLISALTESYPAVDVAQEIRSARSWLIANPTRRKTDRGLPKFLDSWMRRRQDGGQPTGGATNHGPKTKQERTREAFIRVGLEDGWLQPEDAASEDPEPTDRCIPDS